ncbi:MAG: hypothetical protein ABI377_09535 [Devosia sp.]
MTLDAFPIVSLKNFETADAGAKKPKYEPVLSGLYLIGKFESTVK